ncbi:MAG: LuxR C-terminal-related transcriptional regulator [Gemmatimonadota bacterium]
MLETPFAGAGDDTTPAETRFPRSVPVILGLVAIGGTIDLILDRPDRLFSLHVLFELGLVAFSLTSLLVLALQWRRTSSALAGSERQLAATLRSLEERRAERDAWRRSAEGALAGLGQAIDQQFGAWKLTPTEGEIALLLLKGFGHKQIAASTGRSERTVRQHAVAVYQKAGLGGRAELAAFFLHDLMLPARTGDAE